MPCTFVRAARPEVLILSSKAYTDALENMMAKIGHDVISVDVCERELEALGKAARGGDARVITERERCQGRLTKTKTIADINEFRSEITKYWSMPSQRVLGYVIYSPPISVCTNPK